MAGGEPRGWRAVAREMLSQSGVGSQVSPHFAWSRACKEILSLRTENARLTRELHDARLDIENGITAFEFWKRAAAHQQSRATELEGKLADCEWPWSCPECGLHVHIDEDGCCKTCGMDAIPSAEARASAAGKDTAA